MVDGNGPTGSEWGEMRSDVKHIKETLDTVAKDHETRIRCLEKRQPIRSVVEAVTGAAAGLGILLGVVKP